MRHSQANKFNDGAASQYPISLSVPRKKRITEDAGHHRVVPVVAPRLGELDDIECSSAKCDASVAQ